MAFVTMYARAFDSALPKLSNKLWEELRMLIDANHTEKTSTISKLYVFVLSLYGCMLAALALALIALSWSVVFLCGAIVLKYWPVELRLKILGWFNVRVMLRVLMPDFRSMHLLMVGAILYVITIGATVFVTDEDCERGDEGGMATVQYKVLFTNLVAAIVALFMFLVYIIIT